MVQWFKHLPTKQKITGSLPGGGSDPLDVTSGSLSSVKICLIKYVALPAVAIPCE